MTTRLRRVLSLGGACLLVGGLVAACTGDTDEPAAADENALVAPTFSVRTDEPGQYEDGYIFYTTGQSPASAVVGQGDGAQLRRTGSRLAIADKEGRTVWSRPTPPGQSVANLRTQTYRGEPVLTWWQGSLVSGQAGTAYIANDKYQVMATLTPPGTMGANIHEITITPENTALIAGYEQVQADLTPLGGEPDRPIYDAVISIMDIATNTEIYRWRASDHIPLTDTYIGLDDTVRNGGGVYDPYHLNSITVAPDGNLLISLRHTSAVYSIDPQTGNIDWQLGGKNSTFQLGPGVQFSYQHDAQMVDEQTLRIFNNNSDGDTTNGPPSVQWIRLNPEAGTATLVRNQTRPDDVTSAAMGNAQELPNGNIFGSWGTGARLSEFTPDGRLVYDAAVGPAGSYRAYLQPWTGRPVEPPQLTFTGVDDDQSASESQTESDGQGSSDGQPDGPTARAQWNGATDVASWRLLGGPTESNLVPIVTRPWDGLTTEIPMADQNFRFYRVEALDARGTVIGQSVAVPATE